MEDTATGPDLIRELALITNKLTMTIKEWEACISASIFLRLVLVALLILGKQERAQAMCEKAVTQCTQPYNHVIAEVGRDL